MTTKFYNPTTGNDTTGNGSNGNPYLTFGKAASVVLSADFIDGQDPDFVNGPNPTTSGFPCAGSCTGLTDASFLDIFSGELFPVTFTGTELANQINKYWFNCVEGSGVVGLLLQATQAISTNVVNDFNIVTSSSGSDPSAINAGILSFVFTAGVTYSNGTISADGYGIWLEDAPNTLDIFNVTIVATGAAIAGAWNATAIPTLGIVANVRDSIFTQQTDPSVSSAYATGTIDNTSNYVNRTQQTLTFTNCIVNADGGTTGWCYNFAAQGSASGTIAITVSGGTLTGATRAIGMRFNSTQITHTVAIVLSAPVFALGTGSTNAAFQSFHDTVTVSGSATITASILIKTSGTGTVDTRRLIVSGTNAITNTAPVKSTTDVTWSWTAVAGATSYKVSKDLGAFATMGVSGTTYTDTGGASTSHTYVVQAYDGSGNVLKQGTANFVGPATSGSGINTQNLLILGVL